MLVLLALTPLAFASPLAFVGAQVHTGTGTVHAPGTVLVEDGRITAVGPSDQLQPPEGAQIIDLAGKVVIPGLVDTHSHIGTTGDLHEGGMTPGVSAVDAIDVSLPSVHRARAGGITTVNIMPGSGTLIGGQTAYLKLRHGAGIDELLLCTDRRTEICGGMKMANGTNPQGGSGPDSRMGAALAQRQQLTDAQKRAESFPDETEPAPSRWWRKSPPSPEPPDPDLALDPLVEVVRGERIAHFHTHRADDIQTAIGLAAEFDFPLVLHHVSEGWKVPEHIAAAEVPCSLIIIDSPGGKEEALEFSTRTPAVLEEAGVLVSLHTDDPITDSRLFLRSGGLAIRAGMSETGALAALTLNPATQLGLADRIGSLEEGKDADLVVLSGPPFSVYTHVEQTWVEGLKVFDRTDPTDRRVATGGEAVGSRYPELP